MNFIPYGRQYIDNEDLKAVEEVLKSPYLTQGPKVEEFENNLANIVNNSHAVAVNSGTSALHIACLACGVGPGDEVITSTNTFVASANCAVYCGAMPVFADIDPQTFNILPEEIDKKISRKTKAVIPVHFAGQSCDMEAIAEIVKSAENKYNKKIYIIEDASHALGSSYKGSKVGSCKFSDLSVMSFHPVKHITTGEGGAVITNDALLAKALRKFRSHGITNNPSDFINNDQAYSLGMGGGKKALNPWYYEQQEVGYNYRITDLQCALGCSQLTKLAAFTKRRRQIVDRYNREFDDLEHITTPFESPDCNSNFHLYVLLINFQLLKIERADFMMKLRNQGVYSQVHYIPVHTQPYYQKTFGYGWGDYSQAEAYYQKCLSIPLFPAMKDREVENVIHSIKKICE